MNEIQIRIAFKPGSEFQASLGRTILESTVKVTAQFLRSRHKDNVVIESIEILEDGTVEKEVNEAEKLAEVCNK